MAGRPLEAVQQCRGALIDFIVPACLPATIPAQQGQQSHSTTGLQAWPRRSYHQGRTLVPDLAGAAASDCHLLLLSLLLLVLHIGPLLLPVGSMSACQILPKSSAEHLRITSQGSHMGRAFLCCQCPLPSKNMPSDNRQIVYFSISCFLCALRTFLTFSFFNFTRIM